MGPPPRKQNCLCLSAAKKCRSQDSAPFAIQMCTATEEITNLKSREVNSLSGLMIGDRMSCTFPSWIFFLLSNLLGVDPDPCDCTRDL